MSHDSVTALFIYKSNVRHNYLSNLNVSPLSPSLSLWGVRETGQSADYAAVTESAV